MDGCIRDETQLLRAYRYVLAQPVQAGICQHWSGYPYTQVTLEVNTCVKKAHALGALLEGVPYKRHEKGRPA